MQSPSSGIPSAAQCRQCQQILYRPHSYYGCGCVCCIFCAQSPCVDHLNEGPTEVTQIGDLVRAQFPDLYADAGAKHESSRWEVMGNRSLITFPTDSNIVMKAVAQHQNDLDRLHEALSAHFPNCVVVKSKRGLFFYNTNTALLFREVDPKKERPLHICLQPAGIAVDEAASEDKTVEEEEEGEGDQTYRGSPYYNTQAVLRHVAEKEKMVAIHNAILKGTTSTDDVDRYVQVVPPTYLIVTRLSGYAVRTEKMEKWMALPHPRTNQPMRIKNIPNRAACVKFVKSKIGYLNFAPFDLDRACELYQQLKTFCATNPATDENLKTLMTITTPLCRMVHTAIIAELLVWVSPLVTRTV